MIRTSVKTEYSLPKIKKIVASEYPKYEVVQKKMPKKSYTGAPADKTRVSR